MRPIVNASLACKGDIRVQRFCRDALAVMACPGRMDWHGVTYSAGSRKNRAQSLRERCAKTAPGSGGNHSLADAAQPGPDEENGARTTIAGHAYAVSSGRLDRARIPGSAYS